MKREMDTKGKVGKATSRVMTGKSKALTPNPGGKKSNNMVSANGGLKRKR